MNTDLMRSTEIYLTTEGKKLAKWPSLVPQMTSVMLIFRAFGVGNRTTFHFDGRTRKTVDECNHDVLA